MSFLIYFIFIFTLIMLSLYVGLGLFSSLALRRYIHKNSYVNYNDVSISPLSPAVSIISPAYNEEKSIVNNVRTLLALYYSNFEVIVVNDGSSDNTLQILKDTFKLQRY